MRITFKSTKLHLALTAVWVVLMWPTVTLWSESVLWVGIMSCYALAIGHISSYEAANSAGVDEATHRKLNALASGMADIMEALIVVMPSTPEGDQSVTKIQGDLVELREVVGLEDEG